MAELPLILSNPLVSQIILPFVLVFVLVFAILDRSKILGEDKRQINAIISLVIAAIFVSFSKAVGIVINLMPFFAVLAVIILVFLLLYGFVGADKEGLKINRGIKIAGGIIIFVALIIAILVITGYWDKIKEMIKGEILTTIVFIAIIGGALAIVLSVGKKNP